MRPSLDACMDRLTENPILQTLPADKKKKGTHWQEIVAFEKFFKVNYNPKKLRQTIIDAAEVLHEKKLALAEKHRISNRRFLNHHMFETHRQQPLHIKFPPLPNAPFAVAKPTKCPDWFCFITYASLANEKLAKKITITPLYL